MSMILSWALFPLVLAAVALGWGSLVEWGAGTEQLGVLAIPLGLAAAIVVAAVFTAFSASAPAAAPVVAAGALLGLARAWRRASLAPPALVAAVGVLLVFGAPVILSGQATFLGYIRLDDTATWLGFIDQFFAHGRSLASLPSSTYQLLLQTNLTVAGYPSGAFMLVGVGHWVTGIDAAWIFQPYLAVCASALALCCFELLAPVVESAWLRAFTAFIAAQSALLFGYAAWGGIKELTAAFLLGLGMATAARLLAAPERVRARATLPMAVAGAALIVTLGPAVAVYVAPAALAVVAVLLWRGQRHGQWSPGALAAIPLTAAMMLPSWLTLSSYLTANRSFASASASSAAAGPANHATAYGNLSSALRAIQLGGIWLDGDFRSTPNPPPSLINHVLIYIVFAGALFALGWTLRRRQLGLALYVGVALVSVAVLSVIGTVPWGMGKALAISSPAVLLAGMTGGAILFSHRRLAGVAVGVVLLGTIAGGVLWSNYLQYHNVTLAPRPRLAEFQTIARLTAGKGPTFINEYEIYADRHFLHDAAPTEPAEYRPADLPTLGNAFLTDSAWADIDAFGTATLAPYRSLVIRVGPTTSRPSTLYGRAPVWKGRWYELWQQPAHTRERVVEHVPLGDVTTDAYCGNASNVNPTYQPLCPIQPAAVPACPAVRALASTALSDGGDLLAYQRPNPIVVRATDTSYSSAWDPYGPSGTLTPARAGATTTAHILLHHRAVHYQLWLGGSFGRGFVVDVDGHRIGSVSDALNPPGAYEEVGSPLTLAAGRHTITVTYPSADLSPGSADSEYYTSFFAIALSPPASQMRYVEVTPAHASALCGRTLDWLEVIAPA
jgi:hypothetical protein